jgi:16S rRNA (uracil1498-N3)-methyltransferase
VRAVAIHLLASPNELRQDRLEVAGDAYRHLFRARRLERGQRLRVVDGAGGARWAEVVEVGRAAALLRLLEPAPSNDSVTRVGLAVAAVRPDRVAWVVEKATELGVCSILFFPCARAQRFRESADLRRLRRVASAALEQSGGATLPWLHRCGSFAELLELAAVRRTVLLDAGASPRIPALAARAGADWLLVVGPEGGLEARESSALGEAGAGAMSLGPRTLRSETAAVAGAAILLHHELGHHDGPAASR